MSNASLAQPASAEQLGDLYRHHHRWLQQWLRRKLGCQADAADLVQDTFVRLMAVRDAGAIREPRAYLGTVAHGLMVNHLRRRELERAYLEALRARGQSLAGGPEERALLLEALLQIDALLDGLPPKVRSAFLWFQLEGLSQQQIADRLGVSLSSVKQYLVKAMTACLLAMN